MKIIALKEQPEHAELLDHRASGIGRYVEFVFDSWKRGDQNKL
jgi:hypothetical protein